MISPFEINGFDDNLNKMVFKFTMTNAYYMYYGRPHPWLCLCKTALRAAEDPAVWREINQILHSQRKYDSELLGETPEGDLAPWLRDEGEPDAGSWQAWRELVLARAYGRRLIETYVPTAVLQQRIVRTPEHRNSMVARLHLAPNKGPIPAWGIDPFETRALLLHMQGPAYEPNPGLADHQALDYDSCRKRLTAKFEYNAAVSGWESTTQPLTAANHTFLADERKAAFDPSAIVVLKYLRDAYDVVDARLGPAQIFYRLVSNRMDIVLIERLMQMRAPDGTLLYTPAQLREDYDGLWGNRDARDVVPHVYSGIQAFNTEVVAFAEANIDFPGRYLKSKKSELKHWLWLLKQVLTPKRMLAHVMFNWSERPRELYAILERLRWLDRRHAPPAARGLRADGGGDWGVRHGRLHPGQEHSGGAQDLQLSLRTGGHTALLL